MIKKYRLINFILDTFYYTKLTALICNCMVLQALVMYFILGKSVALKMILLYMAFSLAGGHILFFLASMGCFLVLLGVVFTVSLLLSIFFYKRFFKKNYNTPLSLLYLTFAFLFLVRINFNISEINDVLNLLFTSCSYDHVIANSSATVCLHILSSLWHFSNFISFFYNKYLSKLESLRSPYWSKFSHVKSSEKLDSLYQIELETDRADALRMNLWSVYLTRRSQLSLKWRLIQYFL